MSEYAYIRVSSSDQSPDRQINAMREIGINDKEIFIDRQSGKDFNRPAWNRLMRKLREGDVLYVKSIDRLGRNYEEILDWWRKLSKEKRVAIVVLDMPLLDTRKDRDLMGTVIADIILQLLSYVAQTEREFIRQRQAEGIAAAKARGVRFGRLCKEIPANFPEVNERYLRGELSARKAGSELNVSHRTFLKWSREAAS